MKKEDVEKLLNALFTFLEGRVQSRAVVMGLELVRSFVVQIGAEAIMRLFTQNGLRVVALTDAEMAAGVAAESKQA